MNKIKTLLCFALILMIAGLQKSALAQNKPPELSFVVETGFDGYAKDNTWTPVYVLATNVGPAVSGEIRLKTAYPGETYARSLSLPSQSQKEITLFIPLRGGSYTVEFVSDQGQTLYRGQEAPRTIAPYTFLVGIVSSDPSLLNFLAGLQTTTLTEPVAVAHLTLAELPDQPAALAGLDVLIFNDVDTSLLRPAQQNALADWVSYGGRLIVGGGPNASLTAVGLSSLLPVTGLTAETLPTLVDLENYVNKTIPEQGPYLAAIPQSTTGYVELYEQGQPFLVHQSLGRGQVIYFALDFGLAPMDGWAGNEAFWEKLLEPLESKPPFYTTYDAPRSINDTLANISVAGLPSPLNFVAFLCLYIFFMAPVNYFVLKRIKRQEWAWITIPILIILFSLIGYIGGFRARGGTAILRQLSVVWQASGDTVATVDTFIGLYSPVRDRYTLRFDHDALVQPTDGGSGYNGVKTTSSAPTTIYYGSQTELQNLWTDIGSMSTALAHRQTPVKPIELNLALVQQGTQWQVVGLIANNSEQELEDAILLIGDYGVKLSTLKPGQTEINHPLQSLQTQPYSDQTLWGEYYYQLDDVQTRLNDQIIRSIFWPSYRGPMQAGVLSASLSDTVMLLGWQENPSAEVRVEVVGRSVDREAFGLLIVAGQLGGL